MNIKNKLGRVAGIAAAVVICWLSLAGMASVNAATLPELTGCAIQTTNGHYLTAVGGGGRITDVIHTNVTQIGAWEKFNLVPLLGGSNTLYAIQTANGNLLTAVGGGGQITDTIHTDATNVGAWEKFNLRVFNSVYAIQTVNGNFLTAVDGGGRVTDTIHTDATVVQAWEVFTITCGH